MAGSDRWLDGYVYWRGHYTLRNERNRSLVRELLDLQMELGDRNPDNLDWLQWLNTAVAPDPEEYIKEFSDSCPVTVGELKKVLELRNRMAREFPYVAVPIYPIDILQSIVDDEFPPYRPVCRCKPNMLRAGYRVEPVVHSGANKDGYDVFIIDSRAEIGFILDEMRKVLEKIKSNSGSIQGLDCDYSSPLKEELCLNGAVYRTNSDESRAIGLMLFDYLKDNDDSDAGAIRWARRELAERGPKNFGKADSSDRQFQRWLTNTRKCIEAAEVLEI